MADPFNDIVGPATTDLDTALLQTASPVFDRLRREAEMIDAKGVQAEHVATLGALGVLSAGVDQTRAATAREVHEQLAAASASAWFVCAQHRSAAVAAEGTDNTELRARWSEALNSGRSLGAVSKAHIRRPGPPTVSAERAGSGWLLDGTLDWVTSWGLADALLLLAETDDAEIVQVVIPAEEREGLLVDGPLQLAAMMGTATVGAHLVKMKAADTEVADVVSKTTWLEKDTARAANIQPAVYGIARAVIAALHDIGVQRSFAEASDLAQQLRSRLIANRHKAYHLIDNVDPQEEISARVSARAEALHLLQQANEALITAHGGRAMLLSSSAQRWARESLFMLIQAQTPDLRTELLRLVATSVGK